MKIYAMDPFYSVLNALEKVSEETNNIIVDFHGGATSEIQSMHWHLAGKVTAVIGTHLKVLTSDNRILQDKTAVITGSGYCGGLFSICGLSSQIEINKIKYGQFFYSKVEHEKIILQGVIMDIDEVKGEAKKIELFQENCF